MRKTLHKLTHQVQVPGGVTITPNKRARVRIVVMNHACLELHSLPNTYLNSIKAVAKLIHRQTDSQLKTHDSVNQQVLSILIPIQNDSRVVILEPITTFHVVVPHEPFLRRHFTRILHAHQSRRIPTSKKLTRVSRLYSKTMPTAYHFQFKGSICSALGCSSMTLISLVTRHKMLILIPVRVVLNIKMLDASSKAVYKNKSLCSDNPSKHLHFKSTAQSELAQTPHTQIFQQTHRQNTTKKLSDV